MERVEGQAALRRRLGWASEEEVGVDGMASLPLCALLEMHLSERGASREPCRTPSRTSLDALLAVHQQPKRGRLTVVVSLPPRVGIG